MNRRRAAWLWGLSLAGAAAGAAAWLATRAPALPRAGGRGAALPIAVGAAREEVSVVFELAVDSLARGSVRLPQPGFRRREGDAIEVGAVTPVSGLVLVVPPALRPPSPEDGARTMTLTLLRAGREVGSRQSRFYAIGDAVRLRPDTRLEAGDYDLRFALAPVTPSERPIVWFYRLRVR